MSEYETGRGHWPTSPMPSSGGSLPDSILGLFPVSHSFPEDGHVFVVR
jgi:hypothetical protein